MEPAADPFEQLNTLEVPLEEAQQDQLSQVKRLQWAYVLPACLALAALVMYSRINPISAGIVFMVAVGIAWYIATELLQRPIKAYGEVFKQTLVTSLFQPQYKRFKYQASYKLSKKQQQALQLILATVPAQGSDCIKGQSQTGKNFQLFYLPQGQGAARHLVTTWEHPSLAQGQLLLIPQRKKSRRKSKAAQQMSLEGLISEAAATEVLNVYPELVGKYELFSPSLEMAYHLLTPALVQQIQVVDAQLSMRPTWAIIQGKAYCIVSQAAALPMASIYEEVPKVLGQATVLQALQLPYYLLEAIFTPIQTPSKSSEQTTNPDFPEWSEELGKDPETTNTPISTDTENPEDIAP